MRVLVLSAAEEEAEEAEEAEVFFLFFLVFFLFFLRFLCLHLGCFYRSSVIGHALQFVCSLLSSFGCCGCCLPLLFLYLFLFFHQ